MRERSFLGLNVGGFHRVAYTEWGEPTSPPVVCVHGLTRNGRDFDYLARALQEDRRVVCPDLPGRGRSEWLADKQQYSFQTYCADLTALLARLDREQFDWVGTSLGGMIGIVLAAQPGSPIRRLVLNDAGAFVPKAATERVLSYVGKAPAFSSLHEVEQYLRGVLAPYGELAPEHWAHLARHSAHELPDGRFALVYDPDLATPMKAAPPEDFEMWALWDQIRCPVLLLRGETSDVLRPETVAEMRERGPPVEVVEFEAVGHAPSLMDDAQIDVVRRWLLA
jgi:pimeloyl-ACP methyl ester carboxylesterase